MGLIILFQNIIALFLFGPRRVFVSRVICFFQSRSHMLDSSLLSSCQYLLEIYDHCRIILVPHFIDILCSLLQYPSFSSSLSGYGVMFLLFYSLSHSRAHVSDSYFFYFSFVISCLVQKRIVNLRLYWLSLRFIAHLYSITCSLFGCLLISLVYSCLFPSAAHVLDALAPFPYYSLRGK